MLTVKLEITRFLLHVGGERTASYSLQKILLPIKELR